MENRDLNQRMDQLAREVLLLARNTLLVHLRFLDTALSRFELQRTEDGHIATNGQVLKYNPKHVLLSYRDEQTRITRDYLHLVLHCTFQHAFAGPNLNRECWDLACDISVECAIDSMELPCVFAARQQQQKEIVAHLREAGILLTAEKIYRYYMDRKVNKAQLSQLREAFFADDHDLWYAVSHGRDEPQENGEDAEDQPPEEDATQSDSSEQQEGEQKEDEENKHPAPGEEKQQPESSQGREDGQPEDSMDEGEQQERKEDDQDGDPAPVENRSPEEGTPPEQANRPGNPRENQVEGDEQREDRSDPKLADMQGGEQEATYSAGGAGDEAPKREPLTRQELDEIWSGIARHMKVDMETGPQNRGEGTGAMMQNLKAVTREAYDYGDFLRQFAVLGEAVQINDDEFDYIYYTYGFGLYGKMPLIEPLEYKEMKRIKEFVIAIDTSGSVKGDEVQRFIQKTYNILSEEESFFTKINLHIIQCDSAIQEVQKITTREEFDRYLDAMTLKGFGGTDFRPVFAYVDRMIQEKEFINLKGLIYFTDGDGIYPANKPPYDAAFVFVREDYEVPKVPVWAIRLILQKDQL